MQRVQQQFPVTPLRTSVPVAALEPAIPHTKTRSSPRIKLAAERQAKRDELSLSDVTRLLLKGYAKGDIFVKVG